MRVLVVDSNVVYAKKIKTAIECHMIRTKVDTASDVFVMRKRLRDQQYDLVIADGETIVHQDLFMEELKKAKTPTVAWAMLGGKGNLDGLLDQLGARTIQKPYNESEFEEVVTLAMATARRPVLMP